MNVKQNIFYFDLEETLIRSFYEPNFYNQENIEKLILEKEIKEIGIFSAAILDTRDKSHFIEYIKEGLEKRYNITIVEKRILMLQELADMFMEQYRVSMDVSEMLSLYGKDGIFQKYCKINYRENDHCYLIDDSYGNQTHIFHDQKLTVEIIDINKI